MTVVKPLLEEQSLTLSGCVFQYVYLFYKSLNHTPVSNQHKEWRDIKPMFPKQVMASVVD